MKQTVKIRFNTKCDENSDLKWRVLIDGIEFLASEVTLNTHSSTTKDKIEGLGEKWHITCKASKVVWVDRRCIIL